MEENKQKINVKPNNSRTSQIILRIAIIIISVTILILSLITLASTVTASNLAFGKYRYFIMATDAQPKIAEKGDLVIAEKTNLGKIKVGDSIVYGDNEIFYCDEVVEIKKANIVNKVIIAEKNGVSYQFDESEISGIVVKNIHKLGGIITFLRTPVGIILFTLFIICLFALLRILITYKIQLH